MSKIEKNVFGTMPDGKTVYQYEMSNENGINLKLINYGAALKELHIPDRNGKTEDIVLGFDDLASYLSSANPFFGATIGRYANRIGHASFSIDDKEYKLNANENENILHGGNGFDKVYWEAEPIEGSPQAIRFTYNSPHLEEGFPGNLKVEVVFTLTHKNQLIIDYQASTDQTTHVNLTHHSYFNLNGASKDILDHQLWINSQKITKVNEQLIPTGEIVDIKDTAYDFTIMKKIGDKIDKIPGGIGLDNNFVLEKKRGASEKAAETYDPESGRYIEVYTTEPGLQVFTSGPLPTIKGKKEKQYKAYYGLCMEPQHFPDSPNKPEFPSTLLKPGEQFHSQTIFQFGVKDI